jgi:hypothetical protein
MLLSDINGNKQAGQSGRNGSIGLPLQAFCFYNDLQCQASFNRDLHPDIFAVAFARDELRDDDVEVI